MNQISKINIAGIDYDVRDKSKFISVTHADLVALRDSEGLVEGAFYRITDYMTTTTQFGTLSAGHPFDVIVLALSKDALAEEAYAVHSERDTEGYFANSNLSAWKIWYSLDNDTTKFAWADAENGKGVIYRMIDEFNNDIPYDFKNIMYEDKKGFGYIQWGSNYTFMRNGALDKQIDGVQYYGYTSSATPPAWSNGNCLITDETPTITSALYNEDGSAISYGGNITSVSLEEKIYYTFAEADDLTGGSYGNEIKPYKKNGVLALNKIVFGYGCQSNTFGNNCYNSTFGNVCTGNTFGDSCHSNTFGHYCDRNFFGNGCYRNIFGGNCRSNTFGENCYNNTFRGGCSSNTFEYGCQTNTFGDNCSRNSFGNDYTSNTFGDGCSSNTFGNNGRNNTFGNSCTFNIFGGTCTGNTFGNNCSNNALGENCYGNSFGNECSGNTFEHDCYDNSFGNTCNSNSFGVNCYSNRFGNNCVGNTFGNRCEGNTFGHYCDRNTFGDNCADNNFGEDFDINNFGNDCKSNTFGSSCHHNTFGYDCKSNTFGDGCSSNTFGYDCKSNTFGNRCEGNTFGYDCQSNTFGHNCRSNTFGNDSNNNTLGNSCVRNAFTDEDGYAKCSHIKFDSEVYDVDIHYDDGNSTYTSIQNIHVYTGVKDTELIVGADRNYETCFAMNSSGNVVEFCLADLKNS